MECECGESGVRAERFCFWKETMCACRERSKSGERGAKAEQMEQMVLDRGVVRVGESVKAEREERKQMVRACVERRERSESRWCVRAWSKRGVSVARRSERFFLCIVCPNSFSLLCSLWVRNHASANRVKEREQDGCRDGYICGNQRVRQRDRQRSS